jgi:hypothetical protein
MDQAKTAESMRVRGGRVSLKRFGGHVFAGLFLLSITFAGCGYRVRDYGRPVGLQIESMSIPMVETTSSLLGLESEFTQILRREFASNSRIPIVSREKSQTVLLGSVYDISFEPLSYESRQFAVGDDTATYSVTNSRWLRLKMNAKLVDRTTGQVIWERRGMEERVRFNVGSDPLENRFEERKAVERIAQRLAARIYAQTMERF